MFGRWQVGVGKIDGRDNSRLGMSIPLARDEQSWYKEFEIRVQCKIHKVMILKGGGKARAGMMMGTWYDLEAGGCGVGKE